MTGYKNNDIIVAYKATRKEESAMIATNELKGLIVSKGLSQAKVANMLGITPKTFYDKMKKGVFNSDEIKAMMDILELDEPTAIFFKNNVAQ